MIPSANLNEEKMLSSGIEISYSEDKLNLSDETEKMDDHVHMKSRMEHAGVK